MQMHWPKVVSLFHTLAYMVKSLDPDGLELHFTSTTRIYRDKHTKSLVDAAMEHYPPANPTRLTNIYTSLSFILEAYETRLINPQPSRYSFSKSPRNIRKLSLYIFTDGKWQPESDAETPIRSHVEKLEAQGTPKNQVGIQFIQFGDDPDGQAQLERLDSRLGLLR